MAEYAPAEPIDVFLDVAARHPELALIEEISIALSYTPCEPSQLLNGTLGPDVCYDAAQRVVSQLMQTGRIQKPPHIYRASAEQECSCGKLYRDHPRSDQPWAGAAEEIAILYRLCNGDLVKL